MLGCGVMDFTIYVLPRHKITMHSCLREDAGNVQICTHDEGRNQIAISDPSNSEKLFTCSLKN